MDFGRLDSVDDVSFAVPPLDPRSGPVLAANGARSIGDEGWLRAGAPAWARKDWIGRFYPSGASDRDLLRLYAQKLGAIELNATYYRVPSVEVLDGWAHDTPQGFHFCPKLHQGITHRRALSASIPEAVAFAERLARLGPRLGPCFLQLPPWAGDDVLPELDALLEAWPRDVQIAVEMRHPSWFRRGEIVPTAFDLLERRGAGAVISDVAGRRDVCHASLPAPFVLVRFAGNCLHPTDLPRADAWLERLCDWRARGLERAYFMAHQPDDGLAPETLAHFTARARERGVPLKLAALEAAQLDLFGGAASPRATPTPGSAMAEKSSRSSGTPARRAPPRR